MYSQAKALFVGALCVWLISGEQQTNCSDSRECGENVFLLQTHVQTANQSAAQLQQGNSVMNKWKKSKEIGGTGGNRFDFWNHGNFGGGIVGICVKTNREIIHGITLNFAGRNQTAGHQGGSTDCWKLGKGDVITKIGIDAGGDVNGLQFWATSTEGHVRHSPRYGGNGYRRRRRRRRGSKPRRRAPIREITNFIKAPKGMHLMSLAGRASGGALHSIQAYWGAGGGSGSWEAMHSCVGCGTYEYEYKECTTTESSQENEKSFEWSTAVQTEMSAGFEFKALSAGSSTQITQTFAGSEISKTASSFQKTGCATQSYNCPKSHLFQWTYHTNFDGKGTALTKTNALLCTHNPKPCCLPGTFSSQSDGTNCDLDKTAPSTCR